MDAIQHIAIRLLTTPERVRHGWPLDARPFEGLPILGPSSVVMLRWVARHADELIRYQRTPLAELAADPFADNHSPVGLSCRISRSDAGTDGAPSVDEFIALLFS